MLPIKINSTQYVSQSIDERIRSVVLHYTQLNFADSIKALTEPDHHSAHYLIADTHPYEIFQLVPETKRAWHAGISTWQGRENLNDTSIGIEIVNPGYLQTDTTKTNWCAYPDNQINTVIGLLQNIISRYPIHPTAIVGHADIAPTRKIDPGPLFPWKKLYDHGLGAWPDEQCVQDKLNQPLDSIATLQEKLKRYGYELNVNGQYDELTQKVVSAFQMHFRASQHNGKWDIETQAILGALLEKYF